MKIEKCPFCGGEAKITARDVEPQGDPWYGKNIQTFVICTNCGACLFDDYFHEGFADEHKAIAAWNRRSQPENKPLTLDELRQMDGEPVYYAWDDIGWSKVVVIDGHPRIAATINHGRGYECALYTPTDIEGNSYAYRSKPGEK